MTIYHKTQCGCTIKREDMKPGKKTKYPLVCPVHRDCITESRFVLCIDCREKRYLAGMHTGGRTIRCVPCQKIATDKKTKEKNKNRIISRKIKKKYDKKKDLDRRANCKYSIQTCLFKYAEYYNMPCKGCKDFVQQVFHIDEYATRGDFSENMKHGKGA